MKRFNDYFLAGGALIGAAAVLLVVSALTNRGDLTSAALVLSGASCLIGGIFVITLTRGDPPDAGMVSTLPVSGSVNVARLCADLGVQGDAWFVPDGDAVREVIPSADTVPALLPADPRTFIVESSGTGVHVVPAGAPLLAYLRESSGLSVPDGFPALGGAVSEVLTDVLEIAEQAETSHEGDAVFVDISGYRLIAACARIRAESPKICTMHPCPVCSLVACIFAAGLSRPVSVTRTDVDPKAGSVKIQLVLGERPAPVATDGTVVPR